tara:strand:- start:1087 stop:1329 length:243 start_codon:yes stop_codon:yes gene_type:complete
MNINSIKEKIKNFIPESKVEVKDTTGTGDHFSVIVISDKFENVNLVNRHKMIYESLSQYVTKEIHALQIKTYTEKEFLDV